MAVIPGFLLVHRATVEPYQGETGTGPSYGPPVTIKCFALDKRQMVRGTEQDQVISQTQLYCRPGTSIPVHSRVTVNGKQSTVITYNDNEAGRLPVPNHQLVYLT